MRLPPAALQRCRTEIAAAEILLQPVRQLPAQPGGEGQLGWNPLEGCCRAVHAEVSQAPPMPASLQRVLGPWRPGDLDGCLALGLNNLIQILLIISLCRGVLGYPDALVFGTILPAAGVSLLVGNLAYSHLAQRLAAQERRDCLLYTSPSPRDKRQSRMPSSA